MLDRRKFLQATISCLVLIIGDLFRPLRVLAAWNKEAFSATNEKDALEKFYPGESIQQSDAITIGVYDTIENGAYVPVEISTRLTDIKSIAILVEKNPNPLIANFNLSEQCNSFIATRIKMDASSDIVAVIRSGDKLYSNRKFVEVLVGGCG